MFKINEHKKQISSIIDNKEEYKRFAVKIEAVAKNFKMCIKLLGCDNIVFIF